MRAPQRKPQTQMRSRLTVQRRTPRLPTTQMGIPPYSAQAAKRGRRGVQMHRSVWAVKGADAMLVTGSQAGDKGRSNAQVSLGCEKDVSRCTGYNTKGGRALTCIGQLGLCKSMWCRTGCISRTWGAHDIQASLQVDEACCLHRKGWGGGLTEFPLLLRPSQSLSCRSSTTCSQSVLSFWLALIATYVVCL